MFLGSSLEACVMARLRIDSRAVQTSVQIELQRDLRGAQRIHRGHGDQAGDGRELVFERGGHCRGHGFRAGAGKAGGHLQGGEIDVGQIADRQRAVGHRAEQSDGGHQQAGGDGPLE